MFTVTHEVTVAAARAAVWELVADLRAHHRWRDELLAMTHLAGPERGRGARYAETIAVGPLRIRSRLRITVHEPPRRLEFVVEEPTRFPSTNEILLADGQPVAVRFVSRNRTAGATALLDPLWIRLFRRSLRRELARLRAVAEGRE